MDFVHFKTVKGKKAVIYHYKTKKVYLKIAHDSIKVRDLREPDPDHPGELRSVFRVYHKAAFERYPDTIDNELKVTKRLIEYVCNRSYNISLLLEELGSGNYGLISKIINAEIDKKWNELISAPPKLIGFNVFNLNSRRLILVFDLTNNTVIDVLSFRKNNNDHGLMSLHEFLYDAIISNKDAFRNTVFVLPFNYEVYKMFNATTTDRVMLEYYISKLSMNEYLANGGIMFDFDAEILSDVYDDAYNKMQVRLQMINESISINKPSVFRSYILISKNKITPD